MADFVKKVKNNLLNWESNENQLAPLTEKDKETVFELASWANPIEEVENLKKEEIESKYEKSDLAAIINSDTSSKEKTVQENIFSDMKENVESSQQFLNWYARVEIGMEHEEDEPYQEYVSQLELHRKDCQILISHLNDAMNNLQILTDQYASVSNKTSSLHTDCEDLLAEQNKLSNTAAVIESKLAYFTEVEKISQKLDSPAFQVSSEGFIPLLSKIDEGIEYMVNNPTYYESAVYLAKYKQCLNRSLSMLKHYLFKTIENTSQQIINHFAKNNPNTDNAILLYYGKFKVCAPRLKILTTEMENRNQNGQEYINLLNDCHHFYFGQRKILIEPCVSDAIKQLTQKYSKDYCTLVRSGCAFLIHVCEDEYNLFFHFFSVPSIELDKFVEGLCWLLYDVLRPLIIHIDHLETLSELCYILKGGMIEEHIQNNPIQLAPLTNVVHKLLQDCQERLVYRAQIYLQTDIISFNPSPGDLAYPSKLRLMESIAESIYQKQLNGNRRADSISSLSSVKSIVSDDRHSVTASRVGTSPADLHGMWYPTVRRTLMSLSKVYRSVDRTVFQGVSVGILSACMLSLSNAAYSIEKTSSLLDAHLFEIKHLLILREQLAPFHVDASLREMSLDWSKLKEAAVGFVHKRSRLFSLNSNNSILQFIVEGTPQVTEHILDSKKSVDSQLKLICEKLIASCTESVVSPLSNFRNKADVIIKMNNDGEQNISLKNQPFASVEKLSAAISESCKRMKNEVPTIQDRFKLYLANQDTEFILFKPIRSNILEEFSKIMEIVDKNYTVEDKTIISCPTQDEVSAMLSSLFVTE